MTTGDTQQLGRRHLWEGGRGDQTEARNAAEREKNSSAALARRLSRECLADIAEQAEREARDSLLPQMDLEPSPFELARIFYAEDCPDKVLVPTQYLEKYRGRALAEHCSVDTIFPSRNPVSEDGKEDDEAVALEQRIDEMVAEELAEHPTQRVFPWAHYSKTADGYVVNERDLATMFEADIDYYYRDDPQNPENNGK
jgi:hypothetical protein